MISEKEKYFKLNIYGIKNSPHYIIFLPSISLCENSIPDESPNKEGKLRIFVIRAQRISMFAKTMALK